MIDFDITSYSIIPTTSSLVASPIAIYFNSMFFGFGSMFYQICGVLFIHGVLDSVLFFMGSFTLLDIRLRVYVKCLRFLC